MDDASGLARSIHARPASRAPRRELAAIGHAIEGPGVEAIGVGQRRVMADPRFGHFVRQRIVAGLNLRGIDLVLLRMARTTASACG